MDPLIAKLSELKIVRGDFDYCLNRAKIIVFFVFGCQKWFDYEAHALVQSINHGPLIFWLYRTFGMPETTVPTDPKVIFRVLEPLLTRLHLVGHEANGWSAWLQRERAAAEGAAQQDPWPKPSRLTMVTDPQSAATIGAGPLSDPVPSPPPSAQRSCVPRA